MIPVVLLHGASGNAATWQPTLSAWDWAAVACPDLPGRGSHQAHPPRARVEALADWLAGWLVDAALERPILVGHSLGGAVALTLALEAPQQLGGLVLVSSAARLRVAPAILAAVATGKPLSLAFAFGPQTPQAVVQQYDALAALTPPDAAQADWHACDAFDLRHRLSEVACPTLVLHGDADALTLPKHQQSLAEAIPGAQRIALPHVGHMLPWEDAAGLSAAVRAFAAHNTEATS